MENLNRKNCYSRENMGPTLNETMVYTHIIIGAAKEYGAHWMHCNDGIYPETV